MSSDDRETPEEARLRLDVPLSPVAAAMLEAGLASARRGEIKPLVLHPTDQEIAEAAKKLGVPALCIRARLLLGWHPTRALTVPPKRRQGYVRRSWSWLNRTHLLDQVKVEEQDE
jgi:hypothetical protein